MRIGTLFSGIGSPEQAAKRVFKDNLELVFGCEIDKFARETFKANYELEEKHFHKDISDMNGYEYKGLVDIVVGGTPCQDFSIAGLRKGLNGDKGILIYEYIRILKEIDPPIFIYENVRGMLSDNNGKTFKDFIQTLRDMNYYCHYDILNTRDYGVPQNRERVFIVGFKNSEHYHNFNFAPKIKLERTLNHILEPKDKIDNKYYLSDIAIKGVTNSKKGNSFRTRDNTLYANCLTANYFKLPYSAFYLRESSSELRRLTPREAFRLQDFPEDFKLVVSDSQLYKQAGNSISVNIMEMIYKQIELSKYKNSDNISLFQF